MNDNSNESSGTSELVQAQSLPKKPLKVLLSSVSSDSHTWNLVFMQLLLEELGHEVINLGACVPDQMIIDHCKQDAPDLLVISSVNGHGSIDGERMIRSLRADPALRHLPAVIGGKLTTTARIGFEEHRQRLEDAGFSTVFDDASDTSNFKLFVDKVAGALPAPQQA